MDYTLGPKPTPLRCFFQSFQEHFYGIHCLIDSLKLLFVNRDSLHARVNSHYKAWSWFRQFYFLLNHLPNFRTKVGHAFTFMTLSSKICYPEIRLVSLGVCKT